MDTALFIERIFELDGNDLRVRFYAPARAEAGEFQCRYAIDWPDHKKIRRPVCGEDGVQALMLAMRLAHDELVNSDAYKSGRLTLWGQADLDLPPPWGTASPPDDTRPSKRA